LELGQKFPTAGLGVDFEPSKGLVKLWHFGRHTAEDILKLNNAPKGLQDSVQKFSQNDLYKVFCTGVDYEKESMNIYFLWPEIRSRESGDVVKILQDLDIPLPTTQVIECCANASSFAATFKWSGKIERVCFYTPYVESNAAQFQSTEPFATHIKEHPLPTTVLGFPSSFIGCSLGNVNGKLEFYMKLEADYQKSYFSFLSKLMDYHS